MRSDEHDPIFFLPPISSQRCTLDQMLLPLREFDPTQCSPTYMYLRSVYIAYDFMPELMTILECTSTMSMHTKLTYLEMTFPCKKCLFSNKAFWKFKDRRAPTLILADFLLSPLPYGSRTTEKRDKRCCDKCCYY